MAATFNTVPNQKVIKIQKEKIDKDKGNFAMIDSDALQNAMIDLDGNTFKLWMYFSKNRDGHTFALSKVDAIKWGIGSKSSYDRAVRKLIEEGYLIKTSSNHYDFYEVPQKEEITITINKA